MKHAPAFCGIQTFLRSVNEKNFDSDYQIIGMPTDAWTSYRSGARFGPASIREASLALTDGSVHPVFRVDPRDHKLIVDFGDINIDVNEPNENLVVLEDICLRCKHPIVLGGDHSLSYATIKAASKKHGKPIHIVHFDAHCDFWEGPLNHGTVFTHLLQEGFIKTLTQIGIRSPEPEHYRNLLNNARLPKIVCFDARKILNADMNLYSIARYIADTVGDDPVYLTFDIDCLDPSEAPGTGTPESAGLHMWQILDILENIRKMNWCGMDMVEVAPNHDPAGMTALHAATIIWTYLCMQT